MYIELDNIQCFSAMKKTEMNVIHAYTNGNRISEVNESTF